MDTHQRFGPLPPAGSDERRERLFVAGVVCFGLLCGGGLGFGVYYALAYTAPGHRAICDGAVETLLTTRDPVELQRAAAVVQAARCDVVRRMRSRS